MGGINFRTLLYFIASFAVVAVIYFGLTRAVGSIVAAGIVIGLLVVLLLVTLWLTRTKRGNKVAEKIMVRLLKTRFGPRIRRWQIRTYAKQQGATTMNDPFAGFHVKDPDGVNIQVVQA